MAGVATLYRQQSPQLFSPSSCCDVTRCTSRTPTPPSLREESCPSTWTTWPSGTALTSGDPVGCWCTTETVGRAPLSSLDVTVVQRKREKTTCPLPLLLSETGQFAIRPDKKSEPKVRKFKHVAMIAGGTGLDFIFWLDSGLCHCALCRQHLAKGPKCAFLLFYDTIMLLNKKKSRVCLTCIYWRT